MMKFNTEVLTSLGIGLQCFKGKRVLESLNIGGCYIKNDGLQTLAERMAWSLRPIRIQEIILRNNKITQNGVAYLQIWLKYIAGLQRLDISHNEINVLDG
jgi:hypothetical protein